ncbi:cytochrome c biogenesis CcdA family protein [Clostridium sp.]|uniref:cytochrome c biogenesis CcdA family protein n=1 Tax=Clostridium sp. TaxID=1506 RepID=UPI0032174D6B
MEYLILFMEGIITFISPCILPMLPIYISYFAGDSELYPESKYRTFINSLGFVLGFTAIFTLLGTLAGTFGRFIKEYYTLFNIIGGGILVIFGLNYMGVLKISFLEKTKKLNVDVKPFRFVSSVLFGIIFAIGWTPCIGTFLGSALMIAASSTQVMKGTIMLLIYSLGLGIPFVISALLINTLKESLDFIKKNYNSINKISGVFLIVIGIAMMTGYLNKILSILTF